MSLRILFADDQLPSPVDAENERTRREIKREREGEIGNVDEAFDKDFQWFTGLLDYLEKTKNVRVIRARSFGEACSRIEKPEEFDVAVIDLSWWGDATLPEGRQGRHNRGLELLERIRERRRASRRPIPTISLSQNFKEDFDLMSTVLDLDAMPVPKSYDAVGYRALFSAIQHLARLCGTDQAERDGKIKLFISHAHGDADIATRVVDTLERAMDVPKDVIRCTSVGGYKLDLGSMAPEALRRELASAEAIVAILTPHSLASQWVLFELGATWLQAKRVIPLLGGGLRDDDIPGPLRGAAGGRLEDTSSLVQFIDEVGTLLGWPRKSPVVVHEKISELARYVAGRPSALDETTRELNATFSAKRARIGAKQSAILDYIVHNRGGRTNIPQQELEERFAELREGGLWYRLEQLRLLGFLTRHETASQGGQSAVGWTLSGKYQAELG